MKVPIDTSRAPLGELVAAQLVTAVATGDDRLERHYLELKSDLDLTKKTDLAKIAKYILGSANRLPDIAAAAFEGYGVMVIGVAPGAARGVPPVEILDISKIVGQYIGASGPRWDIVRVPVKGSTNEVLVIVVDPPREGQKPFACRKDGEGLIDGRVYIRADGETREAKGDELDRLLERAVAQVAPDVAFEVAIGGVAHPVEVDKSRTLEAQLSLTNRQLLDALPHPEPEPVPEPAPGAEGAINSAHGVGFNDSVRSSGIASAAFADMMKPHTNAFANAATELSKSSAFSSLITTEPETRTEEQYRASVQMWEKRFREQWPSAVDALTGRLLEVVTIRVKNTTKTFFHDVEVKIHLEGAVRGIEHFDDDRIHRSDLDLPAAPRIWGPISRPMFGTGLQMPAGAYIPSGYTPSSYRSPLDWHNSGSVDLRLSVGELRPREEYEFDEQEIVLVLPADHDVSVKGMWEITARDHNEIYSGTLEVQAGEAVDLTNALRKLLDLE